MFTRNHHHLPDRRGFALFMALGAIAIIGVAVTASYFVSMQETRAGRNQLVQARAFGIAEFGLNKIQADWDKTPNLQMNNGATFDTSYVIAGQGTARVRYTRLNDETFWIVSEGRAALGGSTDASRTAVKRVGALLRLRIPTVRANGAITTAGNITVQGSPQVLGTNHIPAGWTGCDLTAPGKAGIVAPASATVSIQKPTQVVGTPQVLRDNLAGDSTTYIRYGDETWNTLQSQANIVINNGNTPNTIQPSVQNGSCNRNDMGNWGEPLRGLGSVQACYNYFPIIYSNGSLHVNSGRGQGILLVDGDLKINGNFEWFGLIVVRDDINKGNGNAKINGAVMARNATIEDGGSLLFGNTTYAYSQCALDKALRGSAQVQQAKERAWAELF